MKYSLASLPSASIILGFTISISASRKDLQFFISSFVDGLFPGVWQCTTFDINTLPADNAKFAASRHSNNKSPESYIPPGPTNGICCLGVSSL